MGEVDDWLGPASGGGPRGPAAAPARAVARPSRRARASGATAVSLGFALYVAAVVGAPALRRALVDASLGAGPAMRAWPDAVADADGARHAVLTLEGDIAPGALGRVSAFLTKARAGPGDVIALSSDGGDVQAALSLGRIVRRLGLRSVVATFDPTLGYRGADCASACVFLFAGGGSRSLAAGSRLGVHRFYLVGDGPGDDPVSVGQVTAAQIADYMAEMGVSPRFLGRMVETGEVRWLDEGEVSSLGLTRD